MINTKIRLIIFFAAKDGEALYNQQKQDWELTVAQIINSYCQIQNEIEGKNTRPFRYDLNQIPYHYTVEVRNRFKGLDLIDRVPDELWMDVYDRRQGSRPSPRKRNAKRQNDCLRRPYKLAVKRREVKSKGEKERYKHLNVEFQRIARRDKEAFFTINAKK